MRREPWHQRLPAAEHYHWFKNLVELHDLTNLWLKEVQVEYSEHALNRGLDKGVTKNLWMLDSLAERKVEDFLDDTSPDDVLARLEHAVWAAQAWTLTHFQLQTSEESKKALNSVLEQLCWNAGRECAKRRWKSLIGSRTPTDLRDIILAFQDSPGGGAPYREQFLIRRAIQDQVEVELLSCPHRLPYHEVSRMADRLCELHWHFLKGYAYALNSKIGSESIVTKPRCIHRWYVIHQ